MAHPLPADWIFWLAAFVVLAVPAARPVGVRANPLVPAMACGGAGFACLWISHWSGAWV